MIKNISLVGMSVGGFGVTATLIKEFMEDISRYSFWEFVPYISGILFTGCGSLYLLSRGLEVF